MTQNHTDDKALNGLSSAQVLAMVAKGQVNVAPKKITKSYFQIVASNLFNWFNLILLTLFAVFLALGVGFDGKSEFGWSKYGFMIPVVINFVIGVVQEIRAKKVIETVQLVQMPKATVIRDGKRQEVLTTELVQGDVIVLESGMQCPVDGTVLSGALDVNEAMVTGEQSEKRREADSRILAGTLVTGGNGLLVATAVGKSTYAQTIRLALSKQAKPKSEMIRGVDFFVMGLSVLIVPLSVLVGWTAYRNVMAAGGDFGNLQLQSIAAEVGTTIVGAIPTGLVLLASLRCALSIVSLYHENTYVRELSAVEGLAYSQLVCFDKTGTLTTGEMELDSVDWLDSDKEAVLPYLKSLLLAVPDKSATAAVLKDYFLKGNPVGMTPLSVVPFNSKIKHSGVTFEAEPDAFYALGAPQFLLPPDSPVLKTVKAKAAAGYRVLAFVRKAGGKATALALLYLNDKIRPQVSDTVARFKKAHVGLRIISGDDPVTVSAIAKRIGMEDADKYVDMSQLENPDFAKLAKEYAIFGRATPDQKRQLVLAYQKQGLKVTMVIDAINDVLAAKAANCSVCIAHQGGAPAAAQIADVTILDGDFAHIPMVIKEGRKTVNAMQRSATLFLMKSILSLGLAALSPVFGHLPYSIEGLYLMSWFVTGIGGFFLGLEDNDAPIEGHYVKTVLSRALPAGLFMILAVAIPQTLVATGQLPYAIVYPHFGVDPVSPLVSGMPQGTWLTFEQFNAMAVSVGNDITAKNALLNSVFFIEEPIATLASAIGAFGVMFAICMPLNKFRLFVLTLSGGLSLLCFLVFPMYFVSTDNIPGDLKFTFVWFFDKDSVLVPLSGMPWAYGYLIGLFLLGFPGYSLLQFVSRRFVFRVNQPGEKLIGIVDLSKDNSLKDSFDSLL